MPFLASALRQAALAAPRVTALVTSRAALDYAEWFAAAESRASRDSAARGGRIALQLVDPLEALIAMAAYDLLGCNVFLIGGETPRAESERRLEALGITLCVSDASDRAPAWRTPDEALGPAVAPGEAGIALFTSGTSGLPKAAQHTWESLAAGVRISERESGSRWLLTYGVTRFAGLQVMLQSVLNRGTLAIPSATDAATVLTLSQSARVDSISATPTFWRKLIAGAEPGQLERLPLRQITLGGEIVDEGVLGALRRLYPSARITHLYASTEMGVCLSVRDGRPGFPSRLLEANDLPVDLEMRDGHLWVRSHRRMRGYVGQPALAGEWFDTCDRVELRGDRVYFLGRDGDVINVGGSKVYPAAVERELLRVPGVREVRVFGTRSSMVGEIVSADVVAEPGADIEALKARLVAQGAATLEPHQRPRLVRFVAALPISDAHKIIRAQEASG